MTPLLLAVAVKSLVVLAVAAFVALCLRRASAAARHVVWLAAFVGILTLPLLSWMLPGWRIATKAAFMSAPYPALTRHLSPASQEKGKIERFLPSPASQERVGEAGEGADSASLSRTTSIPQTLPSLRFPTLRPQAIGTPAYLIGFAIVLLRWTFGLARVRRVGTKICLPLADELARAVGVRRPVAIRLAPHAAPMTWGVVRPVILLPTDALRWPAERLRVVLLHELAHVRRGDWLAQALTALACAAYWFLPPVWLAARQLRLESERACDDVVLSVGVPAPDYARHLLEVLRAMKPIKTLAPAALPMASSSTLETRVRAILSVRANRRGATRPAVLLVSLLAAALLVPLAALRPVARAQSAPPPAVPEKPFVVVIDAGHGGRDSGAVVNGVREKDLNLAFARRLRDALKKQGATVYLTRDSDTFLPTLERPKLAREKHADAFVSVHCGLSPLDVKPAGKIFLSGLALYYHGGRPLDKKLVERLRTQLSAAGSAPIIVKPDTTRFQTGFGVLRASASPAVLIEFGQINNPVELAKLQDAAYLQRLADKLAVALRPADNMPAKSAATWEKSLPGGASVELLAVSDKNAARWWTPDGTRLAEAPCDRPDWEHGLIRGGDDEKLMRIFVLRVRGVADENVNAEWSIGPRQTDGKTHGSGIRPAFRAGKVMEGLFVVDGDIPEKGRHGSLSYGVTAPKWRTYAALPPRSGRVAGTDGRIVALVLGTPSLNGIAAKRGETLVRASDLLADHDDAKDIFHPERRLAAVARDGRNVVLKENGCQFNGYRVETDAILSGLPLRQVKEFRLQTRPRFQVEFEDIALQPK